MTLPACWSMCTPQEEPVYLAQLAVSKMFDLGVEAFPVLMEHLDDDRQSVAVLSIIPCSLGAACYGILYSQVNVRLHKGISDRYRIVGWQMSIPEWWKERRGRTLKDLQVEAAVYSLVQAEATGNEYVLKAARERLARPDAEGWESVGKTVIPLSLRVQGSAEDLIEPVRYKKIDDLFRTGNVVTIGRDLESTAYHQLDLRPTANAAFDGIAFGVVVEFMRDGDVIASKNWWWLGGQGEAGSHEPMHGDITRLLDAGDDATLSMRIRGDPKIAIRVLDADKYWAGEVTIPLTILDR